MRRKRVVVSVRIVALAAVVCAALLCRGAFGGKGRGPKPSAWDGNLKGGFSRTGVWIGGNSSTGILWKETVYACDAAERVLTSRVQWVNFDPPHLGAEGVTEFVGQYVRTGKNTYDYFAIAHLIGPVGDVRNQVLAIFVMTSRDGHFVDRNTWENTFELAIYLAAQDEDGDGLPDPGQVPPLRIPYEDTAMRFPLLDVSGPWPDME